jgi:hypothetical protein
MDRIFLRILLVVLGIGVVIVLVHAVRTCIVQIRERPLAKFSLDQMVQRILKRVNRHRRRLSHGKSAEMGYLILGNNERGGRLIWVKVRLTHSSADIHVEHSRLASERMVALCQTIAKGFAERGVNATFVESPQDPDFRRPRLRSIRS